MNTVLDFNRTNLSELTINTLINELIEQAEPPSENVRQYLGASAMGSECLRRIQYDWMCDAQFPARTRDIFDRGHWGEVSAAGTSLQPDFSSLRRNGSSSLRSTGCSAAMPTES